MHCIQRYAVRFLLGLTVVLPLYACGKHEAPIPKPSVVGAKPRASVAAPAPATAKEAVPAPDDFYIKVDECYKMLPQLREPLYDLGIHQMIPYGKGEMKGKNVKLIPGAEVVGISGKWAVEMIRPPSRKGGNPTVLGWVQAVDLNEDGLCDGAVSQIYYDSDYNLDAVGYQLSLVLHIKPRLANQDFVAIGGTADMDENYYVPSEAAPSFNDAYADQVPVPGGNNDRAVVLKIYPKSGGMPYILLPAYRGGHIIFDEKESASNGRANPSLDGWLNWDIIRWDPKIKKFRNVFKRYDPVFSPENAEYWAVRAWLAERYLDDGLKAFKEREYSTAETLLDLAASTDPRNLDILTWRAHFAYASARYKEAAAFYEQVVLRDQYATAKPPLDQTWFDLGLSYEAQCWQQVRDRKLGDPQGCADQVFNKAQAAYQTYLKLAPHGVRAAEVKQRLQAMQKGVFRTPVGDAELATSAQWVDKLAKAFVPAARGAARPEAPAPSAGTGQPQGAKQADVYKLKPEDLKKIDKEIGHLLQMKGLSFEQSRIDWMIAYKAKFPDADLNDMIARPAYYEALPWVKAWRKAYSSVPK
ncbi:MAG: hypothetical protein V4528_15185 [Pseudomonadota bacterium]